VAKCVKRRELVITLSRFPEREFKYASLGNAPENAQLSRLNFPPPELAASRVFPLKILAVTVIPVETPYRTA
jgi:hypothetical protein